MAKLVSKVYGDALLETAMENNNIDEIFEEIKALKSIFENNPDLKKILESPKIVRQEKTDTIKEIFSGKLSDTVMGFLVAVVDKNRQTEFEEIFDYFIDEVKEYKHIGTAYISSAIELSDAQKKSIEEKLLSTTPYEKIDMIFSIDKELIGGLVIRIKDRIIDSSIKSRLYEIKRELLKLKLA